MKFNNIVRFVMFLFLMILLSGCIVSWEKNPTHHYSLYIDPSFTDDQANDIISAATEWQLSMGNYITFDGAGKENGVDTINIYPTTMSALSASEGVLGEEWNQGINSKIEISTDTNIFRLIALHELGHSLSANHIGPGNIMCSNNGCAGKKVTCADITEVCKHWSVWECQANSMPACQK